MTDRCKLYFQNKRSCFITKQLLFSLCFTQIPFVYFRKTDHSDGIVAGYDSTIYALGDSAQAINGDKLNLDGYDFLGWNTAPDGSGLAIAPGEEFAVTENYMILYTQWVKKR